MDKHCLPKSTAVSVQGSPLCLINMEPDLVIIIDFVGETTLQA